MCAQSFQAENSVEAPFRPRKFSVFAGQNIPYYMCQMVEEASLISQLGGIEADLHIHRKRPQSKHATMSLRRSTLPCFAFNHPSRAIDPSSYTSEHRANGACHLREEVDGIDAEDRADYSPSQLSEMRREAECKPTVRIPVPTGPSNAPPQLCEHYGLRGKNVQ